MSNSNIPSTTHVDKRSTDLPIYQSEADLQILSIPQYCMQPLPTITQPQATAAVCTPCQPKGLCQPFTVELGTQPPAAYIVGGKLVDLPGASTCPFCHENVVTRVAYRSGLLTWLLCAAIMFLGFVAGCCFIPFCMNRTKDVNHYCPRCNCLIYKYKRL